MGKEKYPAYTKEEMIQRVKEKKEITDKRIAESEDLWKIEEALEAFSKKHGTEYFCTIIFRQIDPESSPYHAIFKRGEIAEASLFP